MAAGSGEGRAGAAAGTGEARAGAGAATGEARTGAAGSGGARAGETAPVETVRRPEPGLARGVWEAPPMFFYVGGGIVVAVSVLYALWRRGIVRFRRTRSTSS
ncbi:hypothetical protein [Pendulispora albinea]|uniref:Uncharacterized protein n=1 Tax=Pendulispora albinea TaxID=2741071 RepID=A0ABZ2LKN2_9BACT